MLFNRICAIHIILKLFKNNIDIFLYFFKDISTLLVMLSFSVR
nr:MAG TPA: hypothetical protein [Caudoviricetes sp.]